jgi:hypothetical protein
MSIITKPRVLRRTARTRGYRNDGRKNKAAVKEGKEVKIRKFARGLP